MSRGFSQWFGAGVNPFALKGRLKNVQRKAQQKQQERKQRKQQQKDQLAPEAVPQKDIDVVLAVVCEDEGEDAANEKHAEDAHANEAALQKIGVSLDLNKPVSCEHFSETPERMTENSDAGCASQPGSSLCLAPLEPNTEPSAAPDEDKEVFEGFDGQITPKFGSDDHRRREHFQEPDKPTCDADVSEALEKKTEEDDPGCNAPPGTAPRSPSPEPILEPPKESDDTETKPPEVPLEEQPHEPKKSPGDIQTGTPMKEAIPCPPSPRERVESSDSESDIKRIFAQRRRSKRTARQTRDTQVKVNVRLTLDDALCAAVQGRMGETNTAKTDPDPESSRRNEVRASGEFTEDIDAGDGLHPVEQRRWFETPVDLFSPLGIGSLVAVGVVAAAFGFTARLVYGRFD
ncbi:predicted protein [Uncinocarpus reesii 1704]|uniref:Uncharacterized protein n=1 Tax=Uncinocarpus reesii (strain UAMH 1704) TaxID=336963 RepID=C4JVK9_UNCRE|nr:uncharacterized protein UREG_06601 [Uncinocarpus reesii 1704]EEP81736.1 predicted protein [Uncinocarpus reesii 1704]